jgi:predicted ATP-grasp superfamily ATP-dependent carboligase
MPRVLILGGRAPVALDLARRFARQGWSVVAGDSMSCRLTTWSHSVAVSVRLPSPRFSPQAFVDALRRVIDAHSIDLIVPTCEEVFYLSRYRDLLPSEVRVAVADFATLDRLHSKWTFLELARECGADAPASARVDSLEQARAWAGTDAVVIKPEYSRFGTHVRLYPQGIPADAKPLELSAAWVVQRFCRGRELCSYSVVDRGKVLAHVAYRPTYRLAGSASFWFEACDVPAIRQFVDTLAARLDYTGQIAFDWIQSEEGRVSVLECNPRAVSGVHLFKDDDDLPGALAGTVASCLSPVAGAASMLGSVMLSAGGAQALKKGLVARWWRDYRRARDVIAAPGDIAPWFGGLIDMGAFARVALRERCSLRQASTRDIEWDGQPMIAL